MELSPKSAFEAVRDIGHGLYVLGKTAIIGVLDKIDEGMDQFGTED